MIPERSTRDLFRRLAFHCDPGAGETGYPDRKK